ncbi:MAG: Bug family tripartite tricarboxylate transporter substrate binding protein [bacterium]|jgi:putative tricarboxylic transport membrane protein|nr:tripartite tricarboxylate transporter substrate binding protein [Betaproteobacteria bacterium]
MRPYPLVRTLGLAALAWVTVVAGTAAAQGWKPSGTVEMIIPAGPGGGADRGGRFLQSLLRDQKLVASPIVVVNRPGAGGVIASNFLLQQNGSGEHLLIGSPTLLTTPTEATGKASPLEFTPIARLYTEYMMVAVKADSDIRTAKDLVERLRKDPQSISITVGVGLGNINHIGIALPLRRAGVDITGLRVVTYKSISDATTAVLGGHVDAVSATPAVLLPHVASGRLRVIALAAPSRMTGVFANVPTWKELGWDATVAFYHSVIGPRGMRPEQVAFWNDAIARAVATDAWKEMLKKFYLEDGYMDSAEMRRYMEEQHRELNAMLAALKLSGAAN